MTSKIEVGLHPKCFNSGKDYEVWRGLARASHMVMKKFAFCQDCTHEYQEKMKRASRCENLTFVVKTRGTPNDREEIEMVRDSGDTSRPSIKTMELP